MPLLLAVRKRARTHTRSKLLGAPATTARGHRPAHLFGRRADPAARPDGLHSLGQGTRFFPAYPANQRLPSRRRGAGGGPFRGRSRPLVSGLARPHGSDQRGRQRHTTDGHARAWKALDTILASPLFLIVNHVLATPNVEHLPAFVAALLARVRAASRPILLERGHGHAARPLPRSVHALTPRASRPCAPPSTPPGPSSPPIAT